MVQAGPKPSQQTNQQITNLWYKRWQDVISGSLTEALLKIKLIPDWILDQFLSGNLPSTSFYMCIHQIFFFRFSLTLFYDYKSSTITLNHSLLHEKWLTLETVKRLQMTRIQTHQILLDTEKSFITINFYTSLSTEKRQSFTLSPLPTWPVNKGSLSLTPYILTCWYRLQPERLKFYP